MTAPEKLGRTAWIGYLIAAAPIALFCAELSIAIIRPLSIVDVGPVEETPLPIFQKVIIWSSVISLPIAWIFGMMTWILGITIAHRFNDGSLATIPFLANILPMLGLLWFALGLTRDEGSGFAWAIYYTGTLVALLILGMIAVISSLSRIPTTLSRASLP